MFAGIWIDELSVDEAEASGTFEGELYATVP